MEQALNICQKCKKENTKYPFFMGRKMVHKCEECGQIDNRKNKGILTFLEV